MYHMYHCVPLQNRAREVGSPPMRRGILLVISAALVCGLFLCWRRHAQHAALHESTPPSLQPSSPRLLPSTRASQSTLAWHAARTDMGIASADDQQLMRQMHDCFKDDPRLAEQLAREGLRRFPDSPNSEDRDMYLALALFNQRKIDQARREAYRYLILHPGGQHSEDMAHLAGVRPGVHPSPR